MQYKCIYVAIAVCYIRSIASDSLCSVGQPGSAYKNPLELSKVFTIIILYTRPAPIMSA